MIPLSKPAIGPKALQYITRALKRNDISQGDYVEKFETRFAKYAGFKNASACSNGTMALFLAIKALGIEEGEIIIPSLTFAATADAVIMAGCRPVFADIDENTMCLSAETILHRLSPRTKAIITVGLYGMRPEIKKLRDLSQLPIIEDAAENFTNHTGEADITCFSFFGNKLMTTGEGGMCTTDSHLLKKNIDQLRNHGRYTGYYHQLRGTNGRMSNIAAAIGLSQLEDLPKNLRARKEIFKWYGMRGDGAPWLAFVKCPNKIYLANVLVMKGVTARPGFDPLHHMPAYKQEVDLPVSDRISKMIVLLPCYPGLSRGKVMMINKIIEETQFV